MDTETQLLEAQKPASSRYWRARRRLRTSSFMEKPLSFPEVLLLGKLLYNRWNALKLYGMQPIDWYVRGIRILGRTAIEAHPDKAADRIARCVASALAGHDRKAVDLIDPFLGSGNLMYHVARHLRPQRIVGCEVNSAISELTRKALSLQQKLGRLGDSEVLIFNADWTTAGSFTRAVPTMLILAPPWGAAYRGDGLDLRQTSPPIPQLITAFLNAEAADLFFLIPIAGSKTLVGPIIDDGRLALITHDPRPSSGFLLFKRAYEISG